MTYPQKITFGELRESGVRDVLIYCRDYHCSHSTEDLRGPLAGSRPTLGHRTALRLHRLRQTRRGNAGEVSAGSHGHWLMPWSARFADPITLPDGRTLNTLRDAATYITGLPKAQHDAEEWQAAMETLLLVAERNGPEMMARIGMMRALNRHRAKATPAPRQKQAKAYRVIR
jgi:hypothetical protein